VLEAQSAKTTCSQTDHDAKFSTGIAKEGNPTRNGLSKEDPDDRMASSVSNSCVGVAALVGILGNLDRVPLNLTRAPREITYVILGPYLSMRDITSNFAPTVEFIHIRSGSNNSNSECHNTRAGERYTSDQPNFRCDSAIQQKSRNTCRWSSVYT